MSVVINGTSGISGVDGSAGTPAVQGSDSNTGMFFPTTDTIAFAEGGVEAMRIDSSGNVGIGTTSPASKLNVYDATSSVVSVDGDTGTNIRASLYSTNSSGASLNYRKARGTLASPAAVATGDFVLSNQNLAYDGSTFRTISGIYSVVENYTGSDNVSGYIRFDTRPSGAAATSQERMRIDSSGNLLVGTTASTYNYQSKNIVVADASTAGINVTNLSQILALTAGYGAAYVGAKSNHPLVFTTNDIERARFDISGNFMVGVSSSAVKFLVSGNNAAGAITGQIQNLDTGVSSSAQFNVYHGSGANLTLQSGSGYTALINTTAAPMLFNTNNTERMRIDSSGNVGIGTSSPSGRLHVTYNNGSTSYTNPHVLLQNTNQANGDKALVMTSLTTGGGAGYTPVAFGGIQTDNTNRYGAFAVYVSSSDNVNLSTQERMRIDASGFTQFSGNNVMPYQGAPTSKAAATTLTGAELITGILNTTGTTYTITLPTGTNIEGALTWSANNVCLDWWVINTASGTITIGANGNTTLGTLTVATGVSAHFRIRRTAANAFTVYRLS